MGGNSDERELWCVRGVQCVMISCCSGAELQVRRAEGEILLREMYPTKSDLYERARALEIEYREEPNHAGHAAPVEETDF